MRRLRSVDREFAHFGLVLGVVAILLLIAVLSLNARIGTP